MRICIEASDLNTVTFPLTPFILILPFSSSLDCDEDYHNIISSSSVYRQQEAIASAEKYGQMHMLKQFFPQETSFYLLNILINSFTAFILEIELRSLTHNPKLPPSWQHPVKTFTSHMTVPDVFMWLLVQNTAECYILKMESK